jgi:leader peptidase (prepilin peptidase)/N-methyltransferase
MDGDFLVRAGFGGLLGLVVGSFMATLVVRWPAGRSMGGRSACDACGARLGLLELVPLVSYVQQRGRCRHCSALIDPVHPLAEASCALVGSLALALVPGWAALSGAVFGWTLVALALLDLRHFWLPDALTLPLLALGLALGPAPAAERVLAAVLAGGGLLAVALLYRALRGREGLGLGDAKLAAAAGSWLSPGLLPPLLLLASLAGLGLAMAGRERLARRGWLTRVPFGACLALAAWLLWLAGAARG